jgi:hypothetical protein
MGTPSSVSDLTGLPEAPLFMRATLGPLDAHYATSVLQLPALALPLTAIGALSITDARLARRMRRVAATEICITTLILVESFLLVGTMGITGVGLGFLAVQAAVAIVVTPSVIHQYRHPDMEPGFAPGATVVAQGGPEIGQRPDGSGTLVPSLPSGTVAPADLRSDDARARYVPQCVPELHWRGRTGLSSFHAVDAAREH